MATLKRAVRTHGAVAEIGREAWDGCALNPAYAANPFVLFDFLHAAEASGCAVARTGWQAQHLTVEDEAGRVAAVMPLYLKSHSQGEYVFDYAWADAYERAGGRYYPKLLSAAPFSPVTGPRMMARADVDEAEARRILIRGAAALTERAGVSSLHVTFPTEAEWALMGEEGLLLRQDQQYHWRNRGYADFDAFLADLSSGRRKTIRRERRDALAQLEVAAVSGSDLTEAHWDAFFAFYMDTGSRKWGRPYLNREFFSRLSAAMAERIVLILARPRGGGDWVAGALNLLGDDCLYGRNWGTLVEAPFLHFELCYYQAIEQAIARGLARVEAGAQGQHKIARGYLPAPVYSAHLIADPALREPVRRYLDQERPAVGEEMAWLEEAYSPFRERGGG